MRCSALPDMTTWRPAFSAARATEMTPPDIGRERRDRDAVRRVGDERGERRGDLVLARARAVLERIGGVADQRDRDAFGAEFAERALVGWRGGDGARIELPVAGVDHPADAGRDRSAQLSGIEWATLIASIVKGPSVKGLPTSMRRSETLSTMSSAARLALSIAAVKSVA